MTKELIKILKNSSNNTTFLSRIHLRVKRSNFCFYNIFVKLAGNNLLISKGEIVDVIIPIDEISLLSFSLSNYTNLEERKINEQYYEYLKKDLEPYLVDEDYYYLDNMWVKLDNIDICLKDCYLRLTLEDICIEFLFNSCLNIPISKFSLG